MNIGNARFKNAYTLLAVIIFVALKKQYVVCSMHMACFFLLIYFLLRNTRRAQWDEMCAACNKKEKMISGILTLLGVIMLGVLEWRKSGLFDFSSGVSIARIGYIFGLVLIAIPAVVMALYALIVYFMGCIKQCDREVSHPDSKEVKTCLGIIAFCVILFLLSAYPGIYHGDGTNVLRNVSAGRWSDWHPITYYLFVYLCMGIIKNPFMVILVQSGLFLFVQYQILVFLQKYTRKNSCYFYTILILTAGVTTFSYLDVFYKDTPHVIGLLGFSVALLSYVKGKRRKRDLVLVLAYAFFMACMRHMSILIVFISLVVAVFILLKDKQKQGAIRLLVGALLVCLAFTGLKNLLLITTETEKNPSYVSFTIPLHMLGSYAASGESIDAKTEQLMNEIMPVDKWEEGYLLNPYLADTLSREGGFMGDNLKKIKDKNLYGDIIAANWRYLCHYPISYLTDFFSINTMVWEMGTPIDGYEWAPTTFVNCDSTLVSKFPEYDVQHTLATSLLAPAINASKELPIWKMISYRGGFFNFIIICACVSIMIAKDQKRDWIVGLPAFLSGMLLLISIPAQDPRFILPAIAMGCFVLAYVPNRAKEMIE